MIKTLSIIIPVYNEEKTINKLLQKIATLKLMQNIQKEIIIINDCSTDSSKEKIQFFIIVFVLKRMKHLRSTPEISIDINLVKSL